MTQDDTQAILDQAQKKLQMWMAIDDIRDRAADPAAMMTAIVDLLAAEFETDLCLLALFDQDTGSLDLEAVKDGGSFFEALGAEGARRLAERAVEAKTTHIWKGADVLPQVGVETPPENLEVAAVPVVMGPGEYLGALLLFRAGRPFDQADVELLAAAESQIDSAVIQGHAYYELQQRNKELETIYRVDRIRDQDLPFDEMLNAAIRELCAAIEAEESFIMLYQRVDKKLEMRACTRDDLRQVPAHYEAVEAVAYEALRQGELICHNDLGTPIDAVMCIPLILRDEILGVFGVVNSTTPGGFDREDRRLLNAIASQLDTAIFESLEKRRLRGLLGRSVDPRVMERLLANPDVEFLKGERTFLSVLYADIRGSTSLAERTEPEMLVGFINDYLGTMSEIVLRHEGTLDKFVGDEVIALFSAPFAQADHALRAVRVGLEMQDAHRALVAAWMKKGLEKAPIGVGIATGDLIAGEMGSPQRTDYTVIGRAANLGARICAVAQGGQVLVSQATYDLIKGQVKAKQIRGLQMKGVTGLITVYDVQRILKGRE